MEKVFRGKGAAEKRTVEGSGSCYCQCATRDSRAYGRAGTQEAEG